MAARLSLHEYQRNLSARLIGAATAQAVTRLGFRAGESRWLIDLADAGEVLPVPSIVKVPLTRPWYAGIANIRGNLYSVVDFAALLGDRPVAGGDDARLLLIGSKYRCGSGLLVDAVTGLFRDDQFSPAKTKRDLLWAANLYTDTQGNEWHHLDVGRLIAHQGFLQVGA
jgi:twitching motility protein PilI